MGEACEGMLGDGPRRLAGSGQRHDKAVNSGVYGASLMTRAANEHCQRLLGDMGLTCSMSRAGNVGDNAAMESFFSTLKTERTNRQVNSLSTKPGREQRFHCAKSSGNIEKARITH